MLERNSLKTTVIEASPRSMMGVLKSLPGYKAFYGFLFYEILMKKFRDTLLGFWWLVVRPLIPASVFVLIFTVIRPMQGHGEVPYALFFLCGFVTWNLFHSTIIFMPRTLLWMQGIMRRTYFPRLLIPFAGFGPALVELIVLLIITFLVVGYFWWMTGSPPLSVGWNTLLFPLVLIFSLMFGVAIGMFASVLAVFFRDVVFTIPYLAQMLMFLTPVIYPVSFIPETYRFYAYLLNPMAIQVEAARWALLDTGRLEWTYFILSALTIFALFSLSVVFFLKAEAALSDQM